MGVNVYTADTWLLMTAGLHVPVIPLIEVAGNTGTLLPAQIMREVPRLNVGVTFGVTVTAKVVGVAHCPAVGVNVYVPEAWLFTTAGLHVPVTLLVAVAGNAGTGLPAQIVSVLPKLNAGVLFELTVTFNVVSVAHDPGAGVKVYTPEDWLLITDGLQVPFTLFVDAVGNVGTAAPAQTVKDVPKLNAGVTIGFTVTVKVTVVAQGPAAGVKV